MDGGELGLELGSVALSTASKAVKSSCAKTYIERAAEIYVTLTSGLCIGSALEICQTKPSGRSEGEQLGQGSSATSAWRASASARSRRDFSRASSRLASLFSSSVNRYQPRVKLLLQDFEHMVGFRAYWLQGEANSVVGLPCFLAAAASRRSLRFSRCPPARPARGGVVWNFAGADRTRSPRLRVCV